MARLKTFFKYFVLFLLVFFIVEYGSAAIIKRSKYYNKSDLNASIPEFIKLTAYKFDDNFWLWYMATIVALA